MLALKLPFDGDSTVALVKSILQDQPNISLIPPNYYSPEIFVPLEGNIVFLLNYLFLVRMLITFIGLLVKDPILRMTVNQFLLTPPINGRVSHISFQLSFFLLLLYSFLKF